MTGRLIRNNSLTYILLQFNTIQSTITRDTNSAFIEEKNMGLLLLSINIIYYKVQKNVNSRQYNQPQQY